ncbi:hypothetical protein EGC86_10455 [Shewanella frigidimarina]|nr:hypothetical protein EGC86_10455 [Shewanella frigidimarina]
MIMADLRDDMPRPSWPRSIAKTAARFNVVYFTAQYAVYSIDRRSPYVYSNVAWLHNAFFMYAGSMSSGSCSFIFRKAFLFNKVVIKQSNKRNL